MDQKRNVTVFLHIPKTAGLSLFQVVRRQYPKRRFFKLQFSRASDQWRSFLQSGEKISDIQTYFGHFEFGMHTELNADATYVTMVREPYSRIVSLFDNMMRRPESFFWHKPCDKKDLSLREFIEGGYSRHAHNGQARMILGELFADDLGPNVVERAQDNLRKHFVAVGLTEKFDESLLVFKRKLSWKRHICYQRQNANRENRTPLTAYDRDLIKAYNQADLELYERLSHEFHRQIGQPDFVRELAWLVRKNQIYSTCAPLLEVARRALVSGKKALIPSPRPS